MCVEITVIGGDAPEGTEPYRVVLHPDVIITEVPAEKQAHDRRSHLVCKECSLDGDLRKVINAILIHFTHYGNVVIDATDLSKVLVTFTPRPAQYETLIEHLNELALAYPEQAATSKPTSEVTAA
jgi:hypothetical protein